jgi:hypothetical protein
MIWTTAVSNYSSQTGQSTLEFIVVSLVLVPLFLIVPLLGKYLDLAQTTQVASRYVAFEGAVHHSSSAAGWKTDAELAAEVRRRFYSRNDLSIKTGDVVSEIDSERNPLWVDHRADALLPDFNQVSVQTTKKSIATMFNGVTNMLDFSDDFNLPQDNLYSGSVSVQLANVAGLAPFDAIDLSMVRKTVVLVDPWAAKGPADISSKVKNSGIKTFPYQVLQVPASILEPVISIFEDGLGGASPPKIGRVDADVVPKDRVLQPYQ